MRLKHFALVTGLLLACPASAQQAPYSSTTTEATGTIVATGVYQKVLPLAMPGQRVNCTIQNKGTNPMLAYFDKTGVTQPASNGGAGFSLEASDAGVDGGAISCGNIGGGLARDAVWIEGTIGDTYEYSSQP